jgi:phage host-nuclease inhibitor protein Gam
LAKGVFIYAYEHRKELTDGERKKTVEFITGDRIRWYFPSSSVNVVNEKAALAELKRRGLGKFIRVKREINKEAILQNPERIAGLKNLSVRQAEIFAIVLVAMGIELQKGERKFKKVKFEP